MPRTIKHEFDFHHSPETVWEYLTDPELIALSLMPNDFRPIVGHKFQFRSKPMPRFGFDGIVHCEVLELTPNKKLVYSWKGGALDSTVYFTLMPHSNGTRLILEHKGFKVQKFLTVHHHEQGMGKNR